MSDKEFIDIFNRFLNRFNWEIKIDENECIIQTKDTTEIIAIFKDIDEMLYGREYEPIRNYKERLMSLFDLTDIWIKLYDNNKSLIYTFYTPTNIPDNIELLLFVRGSSKEEIILKIQMLGY